MAPRVACISLGTLPLDRLSNDEALMLVEQFTLFWSFLSIVSSFLVVRRLAPLLSKSVGMRVTVCVVALGGRILVAEERVLVVSVWASQCSRNRA